MNILLKSVRHQNASADILIEGNRFKRIALPGEIPAAGIPQGTEVVDCSRFAILPAFYNAHTHAAMTLFRGAADDLPLMKWLSEWIWPMEKKLDADAVYAGSRLAILEMIKSGTVFFSDMYWFREATIRAAEEMGIRATVGVTFAEGLVDDSEPNFEFLRMHHKDYSSRVNLAVMPHAVYTVGETLFRRCADIAEELDLKLHLHLSETADEAQRSRTPTNGKSPVEYLDSRGILSPRTIAAHAVHLSDLDISILRERGVSVVHCPASNMKLASGIFRTGNVLDAGIRVALGTDGAASNNNLDMREEMKLAALLAKVSSGNPEMLPASKVFEMATKNGAEAYGIDAGVIAEGKLADALLIDLENERLVPGSNLISDWVYSADSRAIDSVLCDGKFVMRGGRVKDEEEIISSARMAFSRLRSV